MYDCRFRLPDQLLYIIVTNTAPQDHSQTGLTPAIAQATVQTPATASPTSTSKRKLDDVQVQHPPASENPTHLLSEDSLLSLLKSLHQHCNGDLSIRRVVGSNQCIYVQSHISCTACSFQHMLQPSNHMREGKPLNMRALFGGIVAGYDLTSMNTFLSVIGVPSLPDSFDTLYIKEIYTAAKKAVEERLEQNMLEVLAANPTGKIPVKFDGTYQTRGYTSQVSVVWLSHADTDKVLDFVVKSKKCYKCQQQKDTPLEDKKAHECTANFSGSSTEMERAAGVEMFGRSQSFGLIYQTLVSDGDSKAYIDVFAIYSICKMCENVQQKFTNVADATFTEWVKSDEYSMWCESHFSGTTCNVVFKRDCINHVAKNFRKDLENLSKSGTKIDGLNSISRSKNALGSAAITRLGKRYRQVIFENKLSESSTEQEVSRAVGRLRTSLYAVLYHSTVMEDPPIRHQYCPDGEESWCPYNPTCVEF